MNSSGKNGFSERNCSCCDSDASANVHPARQKNEAEANSIKEMLKDITDWKSAHVEDTGDSGSGSKKQ